MEPSDRTMQRGQGRRQVSWHRRRRPKLPRHVVFKAVASSQHVHATGRFAMKRAAAMGEGGVHLGSVYLVSQVGVIAKRNLDLLESVAFALTSLAAGLTIGGDWNCMPEDLLATGWLTKVSGVICASRGSTCNGKVYDFFVVVAPIADAVHSVHKISDAGLTPDCRRASSSKHGREPP